jgi:hypothetical protein
MDLSNPIVSGLVGGVATLGLMYLAGRMRPVLSDDDGWFALRPGWLLNGLFVFCVAFVVLMVIALANITSRPDWREQIVPLVGLILGFGCGAVYVAWVAYSRTVRWNDERIIVFRRFGQMTDYPLSAVRTVTTNSFTSEHIIRFEDGRKLRIPTMMKGANDLARKLQDHGFR